MSTEKKKGAAATEEAQYAAEEYAVNDYSASSNYSIPQGYYNDNGEYIENGSYNYADASQYYYGYDYTTGTYTNSNMTSTDTSGAGYNYDHYYSQQAYYDPSAYNTTVPESVAAIQSAMATPKYNTTPVAASPLTSTATSTIPLRTSITTNTTTTTTANNLAPKIYYPSTANPNNPVGPVIVSKTGYTGPQSANATTTTTATTSTSASNDNKKKKKKTTVRVAGGEVWEDPTLEEWDQNDYRLFAGDLGNEVTDELLYKAFSKYPSLLRTRVVRDNRTLKSKGFGFISFKDPDDFVRAWREMNGKYVGNRPIKLRKSNWKERNIDVKAKKERERFGPYSKHR
ncbi:uncharacterized protein BX663DRAFT_547435 [Cokeromyces recurvatus]|uniref:uncharacterized protein n=1 Tax=Cokeromyces recurvatus TaxID=90255 RepID=UPI00221F5CCD|nr:uncharacterized protein BX663DRAFT_547435 [Cokeromyces recurvatus]KAI7907756.1 hypothetical protein BX663DRAFT_547435 [Cokeromyces recurvatus]